MEPLPEKSLGNQSTAELIAILLKSQKKTQCLNAKLIEEARKANESFEHLKHDIAQTITVNK